jgi:hypothetical protein
MDWQGVVVVLGKGGTANLKASLSTLRVEAACLSIVGPGGEAAGQ